MKRSGYFKHPKGKKQNRMDESCDWSNQTIAIGQSAFL